MDKNIMKVNIDSENGQGFKDNIDISGYNFFKNDSFISFKINKIDGIQTVYIKYIYAANYKDILTVLAYCVNFWMGMKIKFLYYREKQKANQIAIEKLKELGFKVEINDPHEYKYKYNCINCKTTEKTICGCKTVEAYV